MTINISGPLISTPPSLYYDNYSGPANPACFLTLNSAGDWAGQSFTTSFKYNLADVEIWIKKGPGSDVGDIDVSLYAVDGNGHPTGSHLNFGVIPNADISEDYSWVRCNLDEWKLTYYLLSAATKYCIVVHGDNLDVDNTLIWACGGDGSDYPGGDQEWSVNSGSSWSTDDTRDQLFRCYAPDFLDNYSGTAVAFMALTLNSASDWAGQSFTAMKSYTLNRIDIWIMKDLGDFVGDILFELYHVDENGHPVGGILANGTLPDADIPDDEYKWIPCSMSGYNVVVDTKYAIVVHGFSLSAGNVLRWSYDDYLADSDYAPGDIEWSTNSGGSWSTTTTADLLFRCYGSD